MKVSDFLPVFKTRRANLMWFLGAGASSAAGVPTAGDMVWEFKRTLYCARQRVSLASCADLGDPKVQRRIGAFLSSQVGLPADGADDEYAFYFELVYPAERDRRAMIDTWQSSAKPSYGHVVLGVFFKLGHTRVVWTTNFDRTVEDAAFKVLGSSGLLSVATLDIPAVAMQSVNEGRQPLLVKLGSSCVCVGSLMG